MTGLEAACIQALLAGTVGLTNIDNHIDIDKHIVYSYAGTSYMIPSTINTKDCIIKSTEVIEKESLKDFIFED